jgi:hypothetical protein
MPDGYRGLGIAALAAALLIAFGLGAFWTGLPYPQERYQSYQDGKADKNGSLSAVTNVSTTIVKRTPCNKPQSETESDLCAQWRAAQAAEKSADWTVYGFWATLAGMALLTWQIMLTREAVKDTGDATIAMQEANRIAREIGENQVRAYVHIESATIRLGGSLIEVEVKFKNIGQSPAPKIEVEISPHASIIKTRTPTYKGIAETSRLLSQKISGGVLAYGCTSIKSGFWRIDGKFEKLFKRATAAGNPENLYISVFVQFILKWSDVFGNEQDTAGSFWASQFSIGKAYDADWLIADAVHIQHVGTVEEWLAKASEAK